MLLRILSVPCCDYLVVHLRVEASGEQLQPEPRPSTSHESQSSNGHRASGWRGCGGHPVETHLCYLGPSVPSLVAPNCLTLYWTLHRTYFVRATATVEGISDTSDAGQAHPANTPSQLHLRGISFVPRPPPSSAHLSNLCHSDSLYKLDSLRLVTELRSQQPISTAAGLLSDLCVSSHLTSPRHPIPDCGITSPSAVVRRGRVGVDQKPKHDWFATIMARADAPSQKGPPADRGRDLEAT